MWSVRPLHLPYQLLLPPADFHFHHWICIQKNSDLAYLGLLSLRKPPVVLEQDMAHRNFHLMCGKETAGAGMKSIAEAEMVRTCANQTRGSSLAGLGSHA